MAHKQKGKVFLVGAGPGDVALFTLKGRRVLEEADVVIYDALVGDGILSMIPEDAEKIDVGKRASHHKMKQEDINRTLLEEAKKGKIVVRLKGGDPFLFGRGGEELELLAREDIPFEIVPGITSPIAVPAYNGIPVTHRDYASSISIITGHQKNGEKLKINFSALKEMGGTFVFLMGVHSLPGIMNGLLEAGMDKDMPAAVLQQGTTAGQKRILATIETLEEEVRKQEIHTPAIIVVGKVCKLAERFSWYEKLPLAGHKILVTRPKELISSMSERLRRLGAEVLELPAIRLVPFSDNARLYEAIRNIEKYTWIAFTSPSGVRIFFEALQANHTDLRKLSHLRIAALGKGTAKALEAYGFYPDLLPETADGEHLGKALARTARPKDRILIPRAKIGTKALTDALADFSFDDIPTYDTETIVPEVVDIRSRFEEKRIDCAAFTSSSSVRSFAAAVKGLDLSLVRAACIGKQTRQTAEELGMQTEMAEEATIDSLTELVIRMCTDR